MTGTKEKLEISIPDMNCASCVAKVEKRLNQVEGAEATVNFATKKAAVEFDPGLTGVSELEAAVDAAGYTPVVVGNPRGDGPDKPGSNGTAQVLSLIHI